jgi:GNAT superfamily N-acetyltransferase
MPAAATPSCVVRRADPFAPEALRLIRQLWEELGALYPEVNGPPFSPNDILGERTAFVVAWWEDEPAGCGAFQPISGEESDVAEIRRMYVEPGLRRRRIARAILAELERLARECGYAVVRLETGVRQPNAIRLYETSGYRRIEPFGRHRGDPISVCFEKALWGKTSAAWPIPGDWRRSL